QGARARSQGLARGRRARRAPLHARQVARGAGQGWRTRLPASRGAPAELRAGKERGGRGDLDGAAGVDAVCGRSCGDAGAGAVRARDDAAPRVAGHFFFGVTNRPKLSFSSVMSTRALLAKKVRVLWCVSLGFPHFWVNNASRSALPCGDRTHVILNESESM